jgi:hypothetical protein
MSDKTSERITPSANSTTVSIGYVLHSKVLIYKCFKLVPFQFISFLLVSHLVFTHSTNASSIAASILENVISG